MATAKKTAPAKKPAAKSGGSKSSAATYTDPALRDRLKKKVMAGDKGGQPGEWSARKAQLLKAEYEKAGGGYKGKKSAAQQHLSEWTGEEWQTSDGQPAARKGGTTRYLPKKAWDELTPAEKKATNAKKVAGSKAGKQVVGNTPKAKAARQKATGG